MQDCVGRDDVVRHRNRRWSDLTFNCSRNVGIEAITTARYGPDEPLSVLAQCAPQLADHLDESVVRDGHLGPDGREQILLGNEPPVILRQKPKEGEGFRPQHDLPSLAGKRASIEIENISIKAKAPAAHRPCLFCGGLVHRVVAFDVELSPIGDPTTPNRMIGLEGLCLLAGVLRSRSTALRCSERRESDVPPSHDLKGVKPMLQSL